MNKDYNVFLCYRGEGAMLAASIYSDLSAYAKNKLKLFYAPKCIKHGDNFMSICKDVAGRVSLMIMILTPGFFAQCRNEDDVVLQELRSALKNPMTTFLPIITPGFVYDTVALEEFFTEQEIDRIKHINAIKYNDVYSFNSTELLLPILKDKVGVTDYVLKKEYIFIMKIKRAFSVKKTKQRQDDLTLSKSFFWILTHLFTINIYREKAI